MTGYEKSPDYGGPDNKWPGWVAGAVLIVAIGVIAWQAFAL